MKARRIPPWTRFAAMVNRRRVSPVRRNFDPIIDGPVFQKKARISGHEPPPSADDGGPNLPRAHRGGRFWRLPGGGIWYKGNRS